jgi:hypothetical protein
MGSDQKSPSALLVPKGRVPTTRPNSSLEEGSVITYNAASDFAVLCSNCHRMIHRSKDPRLLA